MKVKVIGCSTCWTDRPTSSYCINDNILVDCGEGTFKYYKKCGVDFYGIKHIFITHFHSDHTANLIQFVAQSIIYDPPEKRKFLTIYGPKGLGKFLNTMKDLFEEEIIDKKIEDYINIVEIEDFSKTLLVEGLEVSMHKLVHGTMDNIGYVFCENKTRVGFSGDCRYDDATEQFVANTDSCFLMCCSKTSTNIHMGYDKFKMLQEKYQNKKFIATHCIDAIYNNAKELGIETTDCGDVFKF